MSKKYDRKKATMVDLETREVRKDFKLSETLYEKLPEWLRNFKINLDTIGFKYTLDDLPKIKGSALVIDKSMASTNWFNQANYLKDYKGVIIACDRALPTLINVAKTIPEMICQLDSSYLCQYFFDLPEVKKAMHLITGIFATTTHPLTIRLWHGKRVFFTPWLGDDNLTATLMTKSQTLTLTTGGEVSTFAWILARYLQANPIGLFGVYNAYDKLAETEYPEVPHHKIKNKYGTFWQDPVYKWYTEIHKEYIEVAKEEFGTTTINTSMGGAMYSKWIKDMPLKEFVERYA
jgi:hypothetical protein